MPRQTNSLISSQLQSTLSILESSKDELKKAADSEVDKLKDMVKQRESDAADARKKVQYLRMCNYPLFDVASIMHIFLMSSKTSMTSHLTCFTAYHDYYYL